MRRRVVVAGAVALLTAGSVGLIGSQHLIGSQGPTDSQRSWCQANQEAVNSAWTSFRIDYFFSSGREPARTEARDLDACKAAYANEFFAEPYPYGGILQTISP